jgi:uncharacterized membrane protein
VLSKGRTGARLSCFHAAPLWALMILFTIFFSAYAIQRHNAFRTHTADLGQMDLAIWNTAHGRFVQEIKGEEISTRLTDHFEPIFIPISLTFWLWDDVRAILILQAAALALGALPVYWLARDVLCHDPQDPRRLEDTGGLPALVFAAVYLLAPALQAAVLADFHAAPFVATPFLFAFYYARRAEYGKMWPAVLLAMMVKEEMSLLTLMLAGYIALSTALKCQDSRCLADTGSLWAAALLGAVSLAWFGIATFIIIPHYGAAYYGAEQSLYFQRYGQLGNSAGDILRSLLTQPALLWGIISQPERLRYLAGLLASAGFLPLLAPEMLLLGTPILAANLLSSYFAMYSGEFHYSAPLVPVLLIAAIYGARRLTSKLVYQYTSILVAIWLLAVAALYSYLAGFAPWSVQYDWPQVTAHQRLLARFAAQIPSDAPLSTTPPLNPHFSHREYIYTFPALGRAEYVLLDVSGTTDMHPKDVRDRYQELLDSGGFCIVDAADGYILLEARSQGPGTCELTLPDEFYDFARARDPRPQYPVQLLFGDRLRLLGYDLDDDPKWRMTSVRFYWQAIGPLETPAETPGVYQTPGVYRPYPFFFNDGGQVIEDTTQRPMVASIWYPPARWRTDEVVATQTIPWDLGERFNIGLGVIAGEDWGDWARRLPVQLAGPEGKARLFQRSTWAWLGTFAREGRKLRPATPFYELGPSRTLDVHFAEGIRLLGYDLVPKSLPISNTQTTLTLYWQTEKPLSVDYTVFVHLTGQDGRLVAQDDAWPQEVGPAPTSLWSPGETVRDTHTLNVAADAPPGTYTLEVGLYEWPSGRRLEVVDAAGRAVGDKVVLGQIQILR